VAGQSRQGAPGPGQPLLGEALTVALAAARLTDGDVDPTCGTSLVRLGYDRDFARARRHTSTLREPAAPAPGWLSVEFDQALGEVRVPTGTVLDLGATAKALAADRAATAIAAEVGCGVLVNLGGDIRVAGPARLVRHDGSVEIAAGWPSGPSVMPAGNLADAG
jgi:FAD:protein FMN transferase